MRIAVTGANGQISRALQALSSPALEVVVLARPAFDLSGPGDMRPLLESLRPDVVVNAAAMTAVDLAQSQPALAEAINAEGAGRLAAACAALGLPLIQLSTDYVFDGEKLLPYTEDDGPNPLNIYGRSKWHGEQAVAAANPRHVILRTSWVYAPQGRNFITTMLRLAQETTTLDVVADQFGCPTLAQDLAGAIAGICMRISGCAANDPAFGTFHLAGAGDTSWAGFAQALFDYTATPERRVRVNPISAARFAAAAPRPASSRLACGKIAQVYGVTLPHWSTSLARCLDAVGAGAKAGGTSP